MNYKIQAVETIELKRSVGTVDFERIEELDTGKCASFAEIASLYDGGKIKFLQDWDKAIDDVDTSIYKINNYLVSKVGDAITEGLVLNDAKAGDVHKNCAAVTLNPIGEVGCVCTMGILIEADCTSACDKEFTRGYVQEALIKLISEAIASSILYGVEVGDVSELNVTIVNK